MSDLSTFADIEAKTSPGVVDVNALGLKLKAKTPTAKQWAAVKQRLIASQRVEDLEQGAEHLLSADLLLIEWLCDAEGRGMMTTDQIDSLADRNGQAVGAIANAILEATGLADDDLVKTAKNSGETSGGGSPTA